MYQKYKKNLSSKNAFHVLGINQGGNDEILHWRIEERSKRD